MTFTLLARCPKTGQVGIGIATYSICVGLYCNGLRGNVGATMSQAFVNDSLFRPFQSTKKKGLGIGLFQSRMIVQAHQGRMQVETELGKGTTFLVSFPAGDRT